MESNQGQIPATLPVFSFSASKRLLLLIRRKCSPLLRSANRTLLAFFSRHEPRINTFEE